MQTSLSPNVQRMRKLIHFESDGMRQLAEEMMSREDFAWMRVNSFYGYCGECRRKMQNGGEHEDR